MTLSKPNPFLLILAFALLLPFSLLVTTQTSTAAALTTASHYVKPNGNGNCANWENACDLQTALSNTTDGSEIWVASGVYTPGSTISDTFFLADGVAIYGGFGGTEMARSERDWQAYMTILSGDIDGDDINSNGVVVTTTHQMGNNSYHVVSSDGVTNTAVLDGFTITAGQADGSPPHNNGGGMANEGSSPTLANLFFSGNAAFNAGGGIVNSSGSTPTISNVSFSGNSAPYGGGMFNSASNPILTGVSFSDNVASYGGGIVNILSSPTLNNVLFSGNEASALGGGMLNSQSSPILNNASFSGNNASTSGGGMLNDDSSPILINVSFSGNDASFGGGMHNFANSSPIIVNAIFWNNRDTSGRGTAQTAIANYDTSTPIISYSLIEGSGGSASWVSALGIDGGNNIYSDPLFVAAVDPATAPTAVGNLQLQPTSPAINAGNTLSYTSSISRDLGGSGRIHDTAIDMGAYEFQGAVVTPTAVIGFVAPITTAISWDDYSANVSYELFRSVTPHSGHVSQGTVTGPPFFDPFGESALVDYFYYVEAVGSGGDMAVSNKVGAFHFVLTPGD